jgi:hypothetical protein
MAAPSSNESQGLKIAVAVFVMFTVILSVTTYFGFSNYSQAQEKQVEAEKKADAEKKVAGEAVNTLIEFKKRAGFDKTGEDLPTLTAAIEKFNKELETRIGAVNEAIKKATGEYKAAGGSQQKVDELMGSGEKLYQDFTQEPNRTLASQLTRISELLDNQARLVVAYAADNEDLRKQLEMVNRVNNEQKGVVLSERDKTKADLEKEHVDHNQMLTGLRAQLDKLQTDNNNQAQEIAKFKTQLAQNDDNYKKERNDLITQMRYFREIVEKKETVLDRANGVIVHVDWGRNEVRTNLTRGKGARPQMVFSVFDKNAPGLPTDKPKASIELTQVGERESMGRIITGKSDSLGRFTRTLDPVNPVRVGDQLYTPAFNVQRFALIGKIDMDRDGRDDREDLKRMIKAAGGVIDYDLPVLGTEIGKITGLTSWYVTDERDTWRPPTTTSRRESGSEDKAFLDKKTDAIRQARLEGVRPMPIERLLAYLNYSYGAPVTGQVEAINKEAVEQLLHPKGVKVVPPATTPAGEGADDKKDEKKDGADAPEKDDMKKEDVPK